MPLSGEAWKFAGARRETGDAREQLCDSDVSGDALIHLGWVWAEAKETRQIHLAYDMSGMAQSAGRALPGERQWHGDRRKTGRAVSAHSGSPDATAHNRATPAPERGIPTRAFPSSLLS
jgi:hypothetical protein